MHLLKPKEDLIKIIERADRLYQFQVPIIGLTGGIGTGKSTVAKLLKKAHLPLIDADALIKSIYQMPEIIENIKTLAPNAIAGNQIDFRVLRSLFFNDKTLKAKIEKMLYAQMPEGFKLAYKELGSPDFVIYDIPLLFEKKLENKFDYIILVYADEATQIQRVMLRDKGHIDDIKAILKAQHPIHSKKAKSHYVLHNNGSESDLENEVKKLLESHFFRTH